MPNDQLHFSCLNICEQKEFMFSIFYFVPVGETIKIVIEDYVQHLSGYHFKLKFDPELLFNQQFQYQNRIAAEFNTLYHWHPLLPDVFQIDGQEYNYQQFIYTLTPSIYVNLYPTHHPSFGCHHLLLKQL